MSLITEFSESINVPVSAIKLLLTVYVGYVFGTFHRRFLFAKPAALQHFYCTAIGVALMYWNYGYGLVHSAICITTQWLIFTIAGTGKACIGISFIFQLGYLIIGYIITATSDYDINWTMAHCILTLRLIGLSYDVYDGHRDPEKVSAEQKTLLIPDVPSLLEMYGFCYYYGGFNVGPQFPIRRFRQMICGELTNNPGKRPNSIYPAFRRCASGSLVLVVQLCCDMMLPQSTMLKQDFLESSFWYVAGVVCIRGHIMLYQYVAIWMINEGVCILSGLGYHKDGDNIKWDAVRNVKLSKFMFCRSFQGLIESFNINTNQWAARYVFKRLRFLGNRSISHISTLMFLAIWHGYHEGYFTCFLYEFLLMSVERPLIAEVSKSKLVLTLQSSKVTSWIPVVVGWVYVRMFFGYCVLDFSLRKWKLYAPVYMRIYYYGHLFFIFSWILLKIHFAMKRKPDKKED